MPCLGCAERAELLKKAKEALSRGDRAEVARLMKGMLGTVAEDISKLRTITFKTKDKTEQYTIGKEPSG